MEKKKVDSSIYNPPRLNKNFLIQLNIQIQKKIYNPPRLNKNGSVTSIGSLV